MLLVDHHVTITFNISSTVVVHVCSVFGQPLSSEEEEDPSQALINIKPADMISSSK